MELYESYMLNMGMAREDLALSYTSDEVSNVMGELMNQMVGNFTSRVERELQTHITQNQPKMLVINKQVTLSIGANLDNPEARRVSFFTGKGNTFYLELAVDRTEFIKIADFDNEEESDPDTLFAEATRSGGSATPASKGDQDHLLDSLGM